MFRSLVVFACFGIFVISASAQSSRVRVIATPTPAPPRIQNDPQISGGQRNAPVLLGGGQTRTQTATPSATPPATDENEVIKVETNLVTMPVSVLDRDGRFISGLQQKDFKIFENGVEQQVDYFQSVEQPFTVVLLIDVSPSTRYRIEEIHQSAISFVEQLRPNDRIMVMSFDEEVHVLSPPTNDRNQLRRAIQTSAFGDGTSLYEAVDQALNREMKRIQGRKAIVLFTDGVDTTSRSASMEGTLRDVEETDVLIYPIRYNTERDGWGGGGWGGGTYPNPRRGGGGGGVLDQIIAGILGGSVRTMPRGGNQGDYETGRRYLEALALNSGGRKFEADTLANLEASFSGIAEELRRQYSLGYYPDKAGEKGERRQITIRVNRPNVVVRAKNSYIFGQNPNSVSVK
jgi:Ca-activated chloride channel family protein